jgi:DNA-binding transcriptional ArsR family regulator
VTETFAALAEPNRFRIVELLRAGAQSVNDISARLAIAQPQVSKHLGVLKRAGLVEVEPRAQQRVYALEPAPLRELAGWLETYRQLWDARFAALDDVLDELEARAPVAKKSAKEKKPHDRRKSR